MATTSQLSGTAVRKLNGASAIAFKLHLSLKDVTAVTSTLGAPFPPAEADEGPR